MDIPDLSDLEGNSRTCLSPEQSFSILVKLRLESVVLVPFESGVLHNFPHHILNFLHEHGQILISIPIALPHVKLLDVPAVHCTCNSSVQIVINLGGLELWPFEHSDYFACTIYQVYLLYKQQIYTKFIPALIYTKYILYQVYTSLE